MTPAPMWQCLGCHSAQGRACSRLRGQRRRAVGRCWRVCIGLGQTPPHLPWPGRVGAGLGRRSGLPKVHLRAAAGILPVVGGPTRSLRMGFHSRAGGHKFNNTNLMLEDYLIPNTRLPLQDQCADCCH